MSGVEVGNDFAAVSLDLVFENQFSFFETFELDLIDVDVHREARDDLVEVSVFDAQLPQFFDIAKQFAVDFVVVVVPGHPSRAAKGSRSAGS
jgi:hypothetical protein